jgi:hypothetical protein
MKMNKHEIFVMDGNWFLAGIPDGDKLSDASVVRTWSNGKGIGGLAKSENKNEYRLDFIGDVTLRPERVIFSVPCDW